MPNRGFLKLFEVLILGSTVAVASAQTFSVLHSFSLAEGGLPNGVPVQGLDGEFYSTTQAGGNGIFAQCQLGGGCGTIFRIGRYGALTTLYSFCNQKCSDGAYPQSGLAEGPFGSFYGITASGGLGGGLAGVSFPGSGTAFRFTPGLPETTLYTFCQLINCADGSYPNSLLIGWDESYHGTAEFGAKGTGGNGHGTIFRLTPGGKLSTTHVFCRSQGCPDGSYPVALIQSTDGNFYGVSSMGGTHARPAAGGSIFKVSSGVFSTLYSFCAQTDCADGSLPNGLVEGPDGTLYGATGGGGASNCPFAVGCGTVYKVTATGMLTTLYTFCQAVGCPDGIGPGALVLGSDGNLYGVTGYAALQGGSVWNGTVFRITPQGVLTTLHMFNGSDGAAPAGLVQGTDGAFYGTTVRGGTNNDGTFFRLDVGLSPFVRIVLPFGKAGSKITILGNALTGVTAVNFNGTQANFNVLYPTALSAFVPSGVTSGSITVTMQNGTLTSDIPFTAVP